MTEVNPSVLVDTHTHIGTPEHCDRRFEADLRRAWGSPFHADPHLHEAAMMGARSAIVLAVDALASGFVVPNEYVADYVKTRPGMVGFASVDPTREDALDRLSFAIDHLGLRGLKLLPTYQGVHPQDPRMVRLVDFAATRRLPILWHQGTTFASSAALEFARPFQLDAIARRAPELPMWIAHLGHPWVDETMAVIRKNRNLFADISALHTRPFQLYRALVSAMEYRVLDKLFFGSDWPFASVSDTVGGLVAVNALTQGTHLPRIPEQEIEGIIGRDALSILGIEWPAVAQVDPVGGP